jgi:CBS domain-containing protein
MLTVRDILDRKGRRVWSVAPEDTVFQALELMSERHVGALMVLDGPDLVGVVSERDYARKVVLAGRSSRATTVGEIMTSRVFYVSANNTIEECMALMTERSVRHLPVMDESHLDGVVSIGDVVKARISHQEFIIEQLEHFIAGR